MRLPEAVSRLAAPFFGSQAEPSSRQRGMSGPMVVSVWRLVKHISYMLCCASLLFGLCMVSFWFPFLEGSVHPSLLIVMVGSCIYFWWYNPFCWVALEADFVNISVSLNSIKVYWQCFGAWLWLLLHLHSRILFWCRVAFVGNHTSSFPRYKIVVPYRTTLTVFVLFRTYWKWNLGLFCCFQDFSRPLTIACTLTALTWL